VQAFPDGAYAWVPPGGFFEGCTTGDRDCDSSEAPRHRVTLSRGLWLATTEVTAAQYRKLIPAMPAAPSFNPDWKDATQPVVNLTWAEAEAYCRKAGGRLPTEAEWERGARGGHDDRRYPWGDAATHELANYGADGAFGGLAEGRDRWETAAPVGQFPANDHALHDVAGNVWEWTADWRGDYAASDSSDPTGPAAGSERVIRGGSWATNGLLLRVSSRAGYPPDERHDDLGVRCARDRNAR
jgi:formylglycine-generating enzyme required for sulfatase activity